MCWAEISVASHYCGIFIYIDTHAGIDCFQHLLVVSNICVTRHHCWLNESFKLKTNTESSFIQGCWGNPTPRLLFRWIVVVGVFWNVRWWWRLNERHNVSLELNLFFRLGAPSAYYPRHPTERGSSRNRSNGFKITTIMEQEVRIWHSFPVVCP